MTTPNTSSPWMRRIGIVLTVLPILMLLMSAGMKLSQAPEVIDGWAKGGFPPGSLVPVGVVELISAVLYAVPATATLGAVLVTGYLGGAVAVHVRGGDAFGDIATPVVLGMLAWGGLWLRDARLRELLPLRR